MVKNLPANAGDTGDVGSIAPNFRILTWRIPWTEEPGRLLQSWGCKESDMTERLTENIIIDVFSF